jgi:hypothetical protein
VANITVGPVIGKVTHDSARVLIEVDKKTDVECIASADRHQRTQTLSFKKNVPKAFHLVDLDPDTEYRITFDGAKTDLTSRLRTFPGEATRLTAGVVSCNFITMREDTDLWDDMYNRYVVPGNLDLLLHIGDQIYADEAFATAQHLLKKLGNKRSVRKTILRLYRNLYRVTWNHPATRYVLANVSNLMIWDDHEIRDDWGSMPSDYDSDSVDYQVGVLARQVFREYQRQLWEDLPRQPANGYEHHLHVWGHIGVLCLDLRGGRSFARDKQRPFLGVGQWAEVSQALSPSGVFDDVEALIVISSVPLVYFSPFITTVAGQRVEAVNDLKDHWSYGPHISEQIEMLRALRRWKERGNGSREVLVVGGDLHVGGHTNIKYKDKLIFNQLITSPITNRPPGWFQFYGQRLIMESLERLASNYSFEHFDFTNKRNYGIVVARVTPETRTTLYGGLVQEP